MKELSGRASAVLEHYRTVEALRETEKSRLLETLQARAVRGDLPRAGIDLPPPSPAPRPSLIQRLWSAPLAKAGIGVMGFAVTAIVAVGATRPKAPIAPASRPATLAEDPGTLNHARPEPLPMAAEPVAPPDEPAAPAVTRPNKGRAKAAASATRSPAPAAPREATDEATVDEEVRLLHEAQLAVRAGDPRRALTLLDGHATTFPSGKLADAREVTRMVALCDLGARAAAREKADHFLAQHPGSPFSDRVRRICASSDP